MEQGHQPFTMLTFALEGSDAAAEGENGSSASKKRRITRGPRACDSCRSRKIKCSFVLACYVSD
ncbi:hypothetical protein CYLTODRAFT_124780 [Cylindrobasidium torrendii FP15055 ss-10]|uniref:Zn(2)-C6 fungal-type domain-containing protein n=1 Tax=Cylindrobasidium torrendii FP15055 ss-10 TaxID=1314674 RepID=A0A0D7B2P9_9AGAR|nr:hypothetical protein CYLTODRAFT_124780 [Cylindrobasidium torrendii FP15055 ss-10]